MNRLVLVLLMTTPAAIPAAEFAPLPKPVTSFGAAVAGNAVYVYGGHAGKAHSYSTETTLGQFLRLDLAKPAKWEELPGGPGLQGLALVAHGGKLYRIGGMMPRNKPDEKTDTVSVASVACFDPKTDKWEDLPALPEGRSSHDAAVLGDTIYVVGGWKMNGAGKDSDWHTTALVLDLTKTPLKWETIEQPFKRRALAVAACGGKVYAVAGLNAEGSTELTVNVYDPAAKKWSKAADLPGEAMNGFTPAACSLCDFPYVSPADGKVYRLGEKGWETVGELKRPRFVHRLVDACPERLLAIGGTSKQGHVALTEEVEVKK
jgi:N-acetylneuraminic acid mutarotase